MVTVMSTGPTDARPLQIRVADDLRMKIEVGDYQPGDQLPTLDGIAEANLCSLAVARAAVDLLRNQGLVITVQGKGTFVRQRPTARRHGTGRYSGRVWRTGEAILEAEAATQGLTASQQIRELAEVPAPAVVAERLHIPTGTPVWVRRRTTLVDGRPNQLADSYYELHVVAGTRIREENTGPGGGFARLEERGYPLTEILEEFTARMPTGPESAALRLPPGTPVIDLIRTTFSAPPAQAGQAGPPPKPVEVMVAVLAGDMVQMSYQFAIPD